jgi:hypothetical protein
MMIETHDRDAVCRVWQAVLGWDRERCEAELDGERWSNLFEWGEKIWFREGEDHPCIHMFSGAFGTPVGWIEVIADCFDSDALRRHTPWADAPS